MVFSKIGSGDWQVSQIPTQSDLSVYVTHTAVQAVTRARA